MGLRNRAGDLKAINAYVVATRTFTGGAVSAALSGSLALGAYATNAPSVLFLFLTYTYPYASSCTPNRIGIEFFNANGDSMGVYGTYTGEISTEATYNPNPIDLQPKLEGRILRVQVPLGAATFKIGLTFVQYGTETLQAVTAFTLAMLEIVNTSSYVIYMRSADYNPDTAASIDLGTLAPVCRPLAAKLAVYATRDSATDIAWSSPTVAGAEIADVASGVLRTAIYAYEDDTNSLEGAQYSVTATRDVATTPAAWAFMELVP